MIDSLNSSLLSILNYLKENTVVRWAASKSLIVSAIGTFLITCHNHIASWISQLIAYGITKIEAIALPTTSNFNFTLDGAAAYLCSHMRIVDCLTYIVQIIVLKLVLRIVGGFVPFFKLVK